MENSYGKVTLSSEYLKFHRLYEYSKDLNRMSVLDVRLLLYFDQILFGVDNRYRYSLYSSDDIYNIFIENLVSKEDSKIRMLNKITVFKAQHVIPKSYFSWIIVDLRTALYVGNFLQSPITMGIFLKQDYLDFLQFVLSVSCFSIKNNGTQTVFPIDHRYVLSIKDHVNSIYIFRDKYRAEKIQKKSIKWIDENDEVQIDWLHNYLIEAKKLCLSDSFIPNNSEEKYAQILASFDVMLEEQNRPNDMLPLMKDGSFRTVNSIREYYLSSMKNAWNAQVYRRSKLVEKSGRQITLTKENFMKISEQASSEGISINRWINSLIS